MALRINVSLDPEYAEKLSRLADRMHIQEGTLARSPCCPRLSMARIRTRRASSIFSMSCPGAYERTQEGIAQARRGEGIPLDDLA